MDISAWLVPIGLVMLFLYGSYTVRRKAAGWRFYRRILLLFMGSIGLYFLIKKPQYKLPLKTVQAHILSSYADTTLDKSYVYSDVNTFLNSEESSRTDQVTIHGMGLGSDELMQLSNYKLVFEPAALRSGITALDIPVVTEGASWILNGTVQYSETKIEAMPQRVVMTINEIEHSGIINDGVFSIESIAPPAGTYLIDIDVLTERDDTIKEKISIEVIHEPKWNMLVLSSYPTFELNYLKNYWTSLGNGFAMRSKISKEKYQTSFVNAPIEQLDELRYSIVKQFDFIVSDVPSWNALSDRERKNILAVVSKEGSGFLLRPQQAGEKATLINHPTWSKPESLIISLEQEEVELNSYPLSSSWRSIKHEGSPLAKFISRGLGHMGIISISDTYQLVLADYNIKYQNLWSEIFSNLFVDFNTKTQILGDQWVWANERRTLQLYHPKEIASAPVFNDSTLLSLVQVPFLENVIEVDVWPEPGYNQLTFGDGPPFSFYAHDKNSWIAKRQSDLFAKNKMAANSSVGKERIEQFELKTISSFWWYALFLLGFCGLWLDERLYD